MNTKLKAPIADINGLHVEGYPVPIRIGSSGWIDWLEHNRQFRFQCGSEAKFTAYKSLKGYWTAQRRYNGKLRHEYLGDSRHLTWEKLERTATKLNMRDMSYWREKYPARQGKSSSSLIPENYETLREMFLQAQEELERVKAERDALLLRIKEM